MVYGRSGGRICGVLMVPGASRSEFKVSGMSFIRFSSVPGVSGMFLYMVCGFRGFKEFSW